MSVPAVRDEIRFATPPVLELHRSVVPLREVERVRAFVTWVLGFRDAPPTGQSEGNWSANIRGLMQRGAIAKPQSVLGFLNRTPIPDLCRAALGSEIDCSIDKTLVRDFNPGHRPAPAPMHFDAHLYGPHVPMVTVWMPLNDVGLQAPGLSISTRPNWPLAYWNELVDGVDDTGHYDPMMAGPRSYPSNDIDDWAKREAEWPLIEPLLDAGDVAIFDHQHIHGTQTSIKRPSRRMSLEIRILPADRAKQLLKSGLEHMFLQIG